MNPSVFISYAREDQEAARRMYAQLQAAGATLWLDEESLLPGQDWEHEISKAIHASTHFIALISENSVTKRGYVQKELRRALDVFEQMPPNEIFLIPARLDDSNPDYPALKRIQRVDLFPDWDRGLEKILRSLGLVASATPPDKFGTPAFRQAPSDQQILAKIRENAASDHPSNFSTQKYIIDNQITAWNKLKHFRAPGVPPEVLSKILDTAKDEYPFNFSTQLYVVENQVEAWNQLDTLAAPGVPAQVLSSILNHAKQDHPYNFSTQLYVVNNQITAWRALNET